MHAIDPESNPSVMNLVVTEILEESVADLSQTESLFPVNYEAHDWLVPQEDYVDLIGSLGVEIVHIVCFGGHLDGRGTGGLFLFLFVEDAVHGPSRFFGFVVGF